MSQLEWLKRVLIGPLLEECPKGADEREWLGGIFSVRQRDICVYRATKIFELPGTFLEGGIHPVEGSTISRKVLRSELLVARKDVADGFYDVEHDGKLFRLTAREWKSIEGVLKKTRGQDEVSGS